MKIVKYFPVVMFLLSAFVYVRPLSAQESLIEYFEGEVTVLRGDEEFLVDFGEPLYSGDLVATGRRSLAVVRLNDSAQVKLRENTQLWIDSVMENAAVRLDSGGVFARVTGFEVKTPTVVAGVRGTEFFVAYGRTVEEEPDLWLCVNDGVVEVSVSRTGQSVTVQEGEGINILAGERATTPRFFPWTRELNWNFDPDEGEVLDDTDLDAAYTDLLDQDYD